MTYTPSSDRSLRRAIVRLLKAEEAHIFLGEVPHFSDDHEEQERISYYRRKIVRVWGFTPSMMRQACVARGLLSGEG